MKLTTSRGATLASIFTAILVTASLCSIIITQTYIASASNVIYKQKIRDDLVIVQKTLREGNIFTDISVKGFTTTSGDRQLCLTVRESDPDESDAVFEGCGPAQQLIIGFRTAIFGGTIKGFDFTTGEEKTVTINAKLTATGKAQISKLNTHTNNGDVIEVFHSHGMSTPASGSLKIAGGMTFSFDDARGTIIKSASGTIQVTKN